LTFRVPENFRAVLLGINDDVEHAEESVVREKSSRSGPSGVQIAYALDGKQSGPRLYFQAAKNRRPDAVGRCWLQTTKLTATRDKKNFYRSRQLSGRFV
jgi:hypothetical protein